MPIGPIILSWCLNRMTCAWSHTSGWHADYALEWPISEASVTHTDKSWIHTSLGVCLDRDASLLLTGRSVRLTTAKSMLLLPGRPVETAKRSKWQTLTSRPRLKSCWASSTPCTCLSDWHCSLCRYTHTLPVQVSVPRSHLPPLSVPLPETSNQLLHSLNMKPGIK